MFRGLIRTKISFSQDTFLETNYSIEEKTSPIGIFIKSSRPAIETKNNVEQNLAWRFSDREIL
jgi:hypothetical protein